MIDILFLAKNRMEFTDFSLQFLMANTDWNLVRSLWLYDDCSEDGATELIEGPMLVPPHVSVVRQTGKEFGSPVAIMNDFIRRRQPELFAKIDNDIAVPPGWLGVCESVMWANPKLDLLGIEPMLDSCAPAPTETAHRHPIGCPCGHCGGRGDIVTTLTVQMRSVEPSSHIGGIGLMRGRAFQRDGQPFLPNPAGTFFGFTEFQHQNTDIKRGWLRPPLPVVLLDRIPLQPFRGCAEFYVKKGWARAWPPYDQSRSDIWQWMIDALRGVPV